MQLAGAVERKNFSTGMKCEGRMKGRNLSAAVVFNSNELVREARGALGVVNSLSLRTYPANSEKPQKSCGPSKVENQSLHYRVRALVGGRSARI